MLPAGPAPPGGARGDPAPRENEGKGLLPGERLGQAALPGLAMEDTGTQTSTSLPSSIGEGLPSVSMVWRENHVFEKQTPDPTGSRQPRHSPPGRRATLPLTESVACAGLSSEQLG